MKSKTLILDNITGQGILPLYYHESAQVSMEVLRALYRGGVRVVEYTNRGQNALENFLQLKNLQHQEMSDLHLGIGTIKSREEAEAFAQVGADFLVSPIVSGAVAAVAEQKGLLWIPGCMTPTEINTAVELRAALVKIFPANILGQAFITAVKELFPGVLFMPTGGVNLTYESISGWFGAGVSAVGLGSRLITKEVLRSGDYSRIIEDTKKVISIVKQIHNIVPN